MHRLYCQTIAADVRVLRLVLILTLSPLSPLSPKVTGKHNHILDV